MKKGKCESGHKLVVFGSGSSASVKRDWPNFLFINTSFSRLQRYENEKINNLVLAEGYTEIHQVFNETNNLDLTRYRIRKEKVGLLKKLNAKNLFIFTNRHQRKITRGLQELNLNYDTLSIVSYRRLYFLLLNFLIKNNGISFKLFLIYTFSIITNSKPKVQYRPSNGVAGALYLFFAFDYCEIELDGFLSEESFYGQHLQKHALTNRHLGIDSHIIKLLKGLKC
jgi:hypothetical protein